MRYLIGFVVPYALVLLPLRWLAKSGELIGGVPLIFIWLIGCIPLTSLCLYTCWRLFDAKHH
ncbi:hypothetical protein PAN31117_05054 [Pandoraea anapnoica]|uniref:DUF3311 domain-containing protein n=1 Tax=Pandoraea anapnoica TaxID=2508301 RepID=A0A5E5AR43_9BURK|nr:hypothetical protein PIN31009_05346 [Pandoraea iniqua]VVE74993.1 hypothetical protein PAN31117_05054 [Pandoraea anapnoica]